jgi:hypothetical protein
MWSLSFSYKWKKGQVKDHLNSTKKGPEKNVLKLSYGSWCFVADMFCVVVDGNGGCQLWIFGRTVVYGT